MIETTFKCFVDGVGVHVRRWPREMRIDSSEIKSEYKYCIGKFFRPGVIVTFEMTLFNQCDYGQQNLPF